MMDDEQDARMRQALATAEINGVATLKVSDGQIFFFSKKKLQELVAGLEEDGKETCTIFVKIVPPGVKTEGGN
jgi:hypothetical protein